MQVLHRRERGRQLLDDVLRVLADAEAAVRLVDVAGVGRERAAEQLDEGRLAAAVGAHQRHPRVHRELKIEAVEDARPAAAAPRERHLAQRDQRRREAARGGGEREADAVLALGRRRRLELREAVALRAALRLRAVALCDLRLQLAELLRARRRPLPLVGDEGGVAPLERVVVAREVVELCRGEGRR